MGSEHRLDFLGIDVFAARSDYIVHAADQIHVSIFVHDANVAGEIPAVAQFFSRGVRTIEIPGKESIGGGIDDQLAGFAGFDHVILTAPMPNDAHA